MLFADLVLKNYSKNITHELLQQELLQQELLFNIWRTPICLLT